MTRQEIREDFRAENPEITDRVITDAVLNIWMKKGNKEICTATHCIVTNESETFNAVADVQFYDLQTQIEKFLDIDDMPGGGVYYDGKPLTKTTPGVMNADSHSWKSNESGTPRKYWRRGKYLWFDRPPDDDLVIAVDCFLLPDDFDSDSASPFNGLTHLETYHDAMSKYIQWRAKAKVGKPEEAATAKADYLDYVKWMRKQVRAANQGSTQMRPADRA